MGKNRLTFVFQYRIKLNIKNKDQSIEMKTIMCQTCLNVLKNKEVSRTRKKIKIHRLLAILPFHID